MSYEWAFLPMRSSTDLVGDSAALRDRLADDGYLYLPGLIERDAVVQVRREMLSALKNIGWVDPNSLLMAGRAAVAPVREGDDEFFRASDAVQRLEGFHRLADDPRLVAAMQAVLGDDVFAHPLKIARIVFPAFEAISTPPHQDFPNNQGTENLTATWVPLGDITPDLGGLAILRGSHRWGPLPLTRHLGAGNRCALLPPEMLEECRWVTTEFAAGDVLVFGSLTVHAALHNMSAQHFRLSVDFRWQREGEALTEGCLEPHFGRLSWEEIYAGWKRTDRQYYWRDLDYEVVPFEAFDLVEVHTEDELIAEYLRQEARNTYRRASDSGAVLPAEAGP